jgi:hypothetical protein
LLNKDRNGRPSEVSLRELSKKNCKPVNGKPYPHPFWQYEKEQRRQPKGLAVLANCNLPESREKCRKPVPKAGKKVDASQNIGCVFDGKYQQKQIK